MRPISSQISPLLLSCLKLVNLFHSCQMVMLKTLNLFFETNLRRSFSHDTSPPYNSHQSRFHYPSFPFAMGFGVWPRIKLWLKFSPRKPKFCHKVTTKGGVLWANYKGMRGIRDSSGVIWPRSEERREILYLWRIKTREGKRWRLNRRWDIRRNRLSDQVWRISNDGRRPPFFG